MHFPYNFNIQNFGFKTYLSNLLEKIFRQNKIEIPILEHYYKSRLGQYRIDKIRELIINNYPGIIDKVRKGYINSIKIADQYIADVIQILKKYDLFDDTIIIITGDHGESFNEKNKILYHYTYEHATHLNNFVFTVPLIIYKNGFKFKKVKSEFLSTIDIIPTIFQGMLEIDASFYFDGINIFNTNRDYAYSETIIEDINLEVFIMKNLKLLIDNKNNEKNLLDNNDDILTDQSKLEFILNIYNKFKAEAKAEYKQDILTGKDEEEMKKYLRSLGYLD